MYKLRVSDPERGYNEYNKKLNILIVDDDTYSRESLQDIIKTRGHNVTALDEGMKCINRCSKQNYDIIFMDYHMDSLGDDLGEIDGATITNMLSECFEKDYVIYAYTGDNSFDAIKHFKDNNMKGVFVKPVDPSLILDFLKIIENNQESNRLLSRLSMKNKNFIYFKTETPKKIVSHDSNNIQSIASQKHRQDTSV